MKEFAAEQEDLTYDLSDKFKKNHMASEKSGTHKPTGEKDKFGRRGILGRWVYDYPKKNKGSPVNHKTNLIELSSYFSLKQHSALFGQYHLWDNMIWSLKCLK